MKKLFSYTSNYEFINPLVSAKSAMPDWYKKLVRFMGNRTTVDDSKKGARACVPFLDAFTSGYLIVLPQDLEVTQVDDGPYFSWGVDPEPVRVRPLAHIENLPIPSGYTKSNLAWVSQTIWKTPKGYSTLVTHPLNRHDLPFLTLSGIVDSDHTVGPGSLPFFIQEGFTGIIPKGTPIAQLIPFKRDDWNSKENKDLLQEGRKMVYDSRTVAIGFYKKFIWKKKDYS